jgi:uncharacterized membrane protein (DUF485 family)
MSYLRYLCLFESSGVHNILCCVFVLIVFVLCTLCCQFLLLSIFTFIIFIVFLSVFLSSQAYSTSINLNCEICFSRFSDNIVLKEPYTFIKNAAIHFETLVYSQYEFRFVLIIDLPDYSSL